MIGNAAHGASGAPHLRGATHAFDRTFTEIAAIYDRMNDLISFGTHRIAKRMMIEASGVTPGDRVLDLAGGTGDMTIRFGAVTGAEGFVVLADRNRAMLEVAGRRVTSGGTRGRAVCVAADAFNLPFSDDTFDCVAISFGVRNFSDIPGVLRTVRRVLRPGGTLIVLDFSRPRNRFLRAAFHRYLSACVPLAARFVTGRDESYRYLAASVRVHPDQETLCGMMRAAGFHACGYRDIMNGILALHSGRNGRQID